MRASVQASASIGALAVRRRIHRRSRRDFKEQRAFPMAEERWSVANGQEHYNTY